MKGACGMSGKKDEVWEHWGNRCRRGVGAG